MSQSSTNRRPCGRTRARTCASGGIACLALLTACGADLPLEPEISTDVGAFVSMMNEHRVSVGCEPLSWDPAVAAVAEAHSADMVAREYFDHTNPDGYSPFDRLTTAGVAYRRAAENIAWGYRSAQAVLDGWLDSPGHRSNIENCALSHHGVGLVDWHWTHVFTTP